MRVETRKRVVEKDGLRLTHHDLLLISEGKMDSEVLDKLGAPGSTFSGEVRLSDGYGEHYLLLQPIHMIGEDSTRTIER